MKKHSIKRTVSLVAAALMSVSGLAGCSSGSVTGLEDFNKRPNKVSIVYRQDNAYGKEWITEVAREYMTNYNDDTYIYLQPSLGEDFTKIQTSSAPADLYLFDQSLVELEGFVEDMTDVWNSYAIGEEGKEGAKLIKDKLSPLLKSWRDEENTRAYSLPYSQGTTYGFVYNKTVLDEAFPDGYTLPRTTAELFEFGDKVKTVDLPNVKKVDQDVYLMSCSLGDNYENLKYSQVTWFFQLIGEEKAEQFFEGRYWDETTSKFLFDETKPTVYEAYKEELMEFYTIVDTLMSRQNNYVHKDAASMDYTYASGVEAGAGFKGMPAKTVFKVDAPYFESETKVFLEGMKNRNQEQTMGMMRFPIASGIINRLDSVNDEATLRAVIDYVDGVTETKPAGVSDADIEEVADARGMTSMFTGGGMVIPKTSANKKGAKDFIRFMCSDTAAIVAAKALNGLELLPYGKTVSNEELGFKKSHFLETVSEWNTKNTILASDDGAFATWGNFYVGIEANTICYTIFRGNGVGAENWWKNNYDAYAYDWSVRVKDYKSHGYSTAN
ncbi:MAG: extracellular solute-binding protein [Clostridia bacterium]|nr:extracellular solute-binding protein [Clostridia bacterium]